MGFVCHFIGLIAALLFSAFGALAMPVAPNATDQAEFFPQQVAVFAEHTNMHFAARAPPMAVANVEITGGVTVMQGSAFALRGQETVAALFGFGGDHNATNTGGVNLPATQWDNWTPPAGYVRNADGTVTHVGSGQVYTPLRSSNGQVRVDGNGNPIFTTQSGGSTAQTTLTNPSTSGPTITPPAPNRTPDFTTVGSGDNFRRTTQVDGENVTFKSGHAYNRTHSGGDVSKIGTMDEVETAIVNDIQSGHKLGSLPPRTTQKHTVEINGQKLEYTLADTPVGPSINYYPKIE